MYAIAASRSPCDQASKYARATSNGAAAMRTTLDRATDTGTIVPARGRGTDDTIGHVNAPWWRLAEHEQTTESTRRPSDAGR